MILVISHPQDIHARAVLDALRALDAPVQLLNIADFPQQIGLHIEAGGGSGMGSYQRRLQLPGEAAALDLAEVGAVWWRRPQAPQLHEAISRPSHRSFAFNECSEALAGLWLTLDEALWVNPPPRDEVAARKAYQLQLAQRCGLRVPRSCITNQPEAARAFIQREGLGKVICKSFSATHADWRETRLVQQAEVDLLDAVRTAPVIFQEYVEAEVDLRVTMIGPHCFPAAIDSQATRYRVDFRMDMERAAIRPDTLPAPVEQGLRRLMQQLGLVYGAIDLRRTPQGEHVFLEVNPAGQFLFIEEKSGQPIAATLAQFLLEAERRRDEAAGAAIKPMRPIRFKPKRVA